MAFAATARALPNNPRSVGGFVTRSWRCTNAAGDTGGDIDTGFAYIASVAWEVESHVDSPTAKILIKDADGTANTDRKGPTVTIETGDNVDGELIVVGRGVQKVN